MALLCEKRDRILVITFNRPKALNSYDPEMCEEFSSALVKFRDDPELRVAIVTGTGEKAFCGGADLKTLIPGMVDKSYAVPPMLMRGYHQIWKPFIAAINGMALGGGLETALACDLRIASENAVLGTPEVKWNLIPGWGGTQRLPRMLPRAIAAQILLTGEFISAQEAYRVGLVNKVVPPQDLMPTAMEWAKKMCENGPIAMQAAKEAMIKGSEMTLEDGLRLEYLLMGEVLATEDVKEGLDAFAKRRKPEYKGK